MYSYIYILCQTWRGAVRIDTHVSNCCTDHDAPGRGMLSPTGTSKLTYVSYRTWYTASSYL